MRTPREAANALNMNNILFMNTNLQITRPAKYKGAFEEHVNWEHILARYDMKPEEFQLGQILAPSVIKAATIPIRKSSNIDSGEMDDGNDEEENIHVVKAELAQVKRALEITRHQLEESNKKSEARKEQLVSLNKKWSEGKTELTEHKQELEQVRDELAKKAKFGSSANGGISVTVDMDSRVEAQELKKKHEETQGMLRGVTESLLKATEKLQNERKARKTLEQKFLEVSQSDGFKLSLERDPEEAKKLAAASLGDGSIDFASLRAELKVETDSSDTPVGEAKNGAEADAMDEDDDGPKLESLKEFLANTPKTNIDWSAAATTPSNAATTSTATPSSTRSRDRVGVRLCRLLIRSNELTIDEANEVTNMASKYNLGGFVRTGQPGFVIVEGLEFNCDIFMDNMERQKKKFAKVGKVSERGSRAFPMQLTTLTGDSNLEEFAKACESVSIKDKLDESLSSSK
jgi:myosin heavy subunit